MKNSDRDRVAAPTESLAGNLNNEEGNIDSLRKIKKEGEGCTCDQCGYLDCVCTQERPQDLSQKKD